MYNINGDRVGTLYSYWDATVELYGEDQIATTAAIFIVSLCFTVLPVVLLIIYPTKCFQKCFGRCHWRRQQALRTFMSAFNGYYKDGTEGTRDCRYFAAVDLVIRIIPPLIYAMTQNAMFHTLTIFFLIILAILMMLINPYKKNYGWYNTVDVVLILLTVLFLTSVISIYLSSIIDYERYFVLCNTVSLILPIAALGYILAIMVHWLFSQSWMQKFSCTEWFICHSWWKKHNPEYATEQDINLPDRLNNPNDYIHVH